jgi:hypothetical protein
LGKVVFPSPWSRRDKIVTELFVREKERKKMEVLLCEENQIRSGCHSYDGQNEVI